MSIQASPQKRKIREGPPPYCIRRLMEVNLPMMNLEREMTSSVWIKRWMSLSKRYTSLPVGKAAESRALLVLLDEQLEAWQELL